MFTSIIERGLRNKLILCAFTIAVALIFGKFGSIARLPLLVTAIVFFLVMSVSFVRGTDGLYLLIFAMLFSPEIASGFSTGRITGEGAGEVTIRLEDIIMLAVILGWILRSVYMGRSVGIIKTPINPAIWIYMSASIIATLLGLLDGSVRFFLAGILNNLKYFEYFLLFFMILAHVRGKENIARMIGALFIVFFLVMIYGYTQIRSGGRVCAPFDAEPNTFGGYIVLLICLAGGIALTDSRGHIRAMMIFLLLFAIPPLLFTLSRASYFALIFGLLSFLTVSHRRILIGAVLIGLVTAMMLGLPMLPEVVQERVTGTFREETEYHEKIGPIDFDASSSARIVSYKQALKMWVKSPLFGYGVTGTHFIDGQYPRLLVETGIVGLSAFIFIFWRLLAHVHNIFRETGDPFLKGTAMGFFCGTLAMLAHALSANSFIIIRIAEPFWLIAGLVLLIPMIEKSFDNRERAVADATVNPGIVPNLRGNFRPKGRNVANGYCTNP